MTSDKRIEQLLVEVTAQRLITRAIIGHMVANSRKPIPAVISDFEEAITKASLVRLPDVDDALQEQACELARARGEALLANLGALIAPLRARKTAA